jgi:hypothetical protein
MKLLRTVLVWLLLLALPLQGFASASMLCAPAAPVPMMQMPDGPHDYAAMMHGHGDGSAHSNAKCGNAAACCVGAALAPYIVLPPSLPPLPSEAIPFSALAPMPVDLAALDRPPKSRLA